MESRRAFFVAHLKIFNFKIGDFLPMVIRLESIMRNRDHHKKPPGGVPQKSSNSTCGCLESTTKSQPFDVEMTSMFNPPKKTTSFGGNHLGRRVT